MTRHVIEQLLLIEDNPGDTRLLREMVGEQRTPRITVTQVDRMSAAERHLIRHPVDIILLDLQLPDAHGLEAVGMARAVAPQVPLVVLTGLDDESLAAQALQQGAQDYLVKGQIDTRGLLRALRYSVERKALEEALLVEKERAQLTLNCMADGVACTDIHGNITFLNVSAERLTGWSSEEAAGRAIAEVVRITLPGSGQFLNPMDLEGERKRGDQAMSNGVLIRRDGRETPIEDSVAPIYDHGGDATGLVIVIRDVTKDRAMKLAITHSAQHDFLTGLPNRMLLNDRIRQVIALAPRHKKRVAVLFLDLDGFKHINDSLGHPIGDKLLQSIAERLVTRVRGSDTVSRQGGDEFVILLSQVDHWEDAAVMAKRLLTAVAGGHTIDQHDLHVTASMGVSVFPDDGVDADTLIKNADTAMYQAKENGRHSYRFFKAEMNQRAVERHSIEESLRRALKNQEFALHYQPKINLKTGAITGAEALIRWTHPTRGLVSPAQFIPIAEDCGLILPIGHWVLAEACRQVRAWLDAGLPVPAMAVNVSAMEFRGENFLDGVFSVLSETGVDPELLELELTESVLMKHMEFAASILTSLRERGVNIALDDFGTGYSSLSYLRRFPIDSLKMDTSFVGQINAAGQDTTLVTTVINMARNLKLRIIAEGVETLEQVDFLRSHLCDEAQGYYFSRPVPAGDFADLLEPGRLRKAALAN